MNQDLIRIVDGIARDRNIDKESIFADLEAAMVSAVRKQFGIEEDVTVTIDRMSGIISATAEGEPIEMERLGRIAAQTAKQVMIQKLREDERGAIFTEYSERQGQIITGTVARFEGGSLVVNLPRTEGFLPRSEQIPGETHHPGERIRCMILEVREAPHQVKIILTRTHPDFIRRLFELEVPEVAERIIEIKALAREAGYRTKIAVTSIDSKVDAVGACVGVRGSRIKNIVEELGGEKIDIVRWNESSQVLIGNALKPAEIAEIVLCFELGRATVVVNEDQLSLAIGKRGQNVRLAARLTGWDIDILTPTEFNRHLDSVEEMLGMVEGIPENLQDKLMALGLISLDDVEEVGKVQDAGKNVFIQDLELEKQMVDEIVVLASTKAKELSQRAEQERQQREQAKAEQAAAEQAEADAARAALEGVGAGENEGEAEGEDASEGGEGEVQIESAEPQGDPDTEQSESTESAESQEPEAAVEPEASVEPVQPQSEATAEAEAETN